MLYEPPPSVNPQLHYSTLSVPSSISPWDRNGPTHIPESRLNVPKYKPEKVYLPIVEQKPIQPTKPIATVRAEVPRISMDTLESSPEKSGVINSLRLHGEEEETQGMVIIPIRPRQPLTS